jgi:hypothetical protein
MDIVIDGKRGMRQGYLRGYQHNLVIGRICRFISTDGADNIRTEFKSVFE